MTLTIKEIKNGRGVENPNKKDFGCRYIADFHRSPDKSGSLSCP